jgi:hypothetical protein
MGEAVGLSIACAVFFVWAAFAAYHTTGWFRVWNVACAVMVATALTVFWMVSTALTVFWMVWP